MDATPSAFSNGSRCVLGDVSCILSSELTVFISNATFR